MKKLFILAAAAIGLVACNNDENNYSAAPSDGLIHLTASVKSSEGTTRASAAGELQNAAFVAGKTIFVEAYETGEATAYTSGTYTTGDAGALTGSLRYPANNHAIDLCAYYPGDITSSSTAFSVQTDQSEVSNYQASDLMYATKLTNKGSNATHNLVFNHALTKVVVNIVAGAGVTDDNITTSPGVTAVKLNNTLPNAQLAIANGVITASQASSGSAAEINITGTGASNVGIIVPQQVAAGAFITVTYNSIDYTYSLPEAKTFEGGKVYTYTLTLGAKAITLTATSINEWTAGAGDTSSFDMSTGAATGVSLAEAQIGYVVCTDGLCYEPSWVIPSGKTKAGVVTYKNGVNGSVVALYNCGGDADNEGIAYTKGGMNNDLSNIPAVSGHTWKVGSIAEYTRALKNYDIYNDTNNCLLSTIFTAVGGRALGVDVRFWTDEESNLEQDIFGRDFVRYASGWLDFDYVYAYNQDATRYVRPLFEF